VAAAVVVLPAASEQMMNALRAWSHGLPVLLCGAGSASADLYGAAGLKAEATVQSLANGLLTLIRMSGTKRRAMGATGRRLVEPRLAPAAIADDMLRVYRWVLGRGPRPACILEH
jgi:glycosyltransferase involved in cell wall biosynthesis